MISLLGDILLCGITVAIELLGVFIFAMLTQLFFYKVLGINLYRQMNKLFK